MASKEEEKLNGKIALITGGSRGIGKAIAMAYAREGAGVFICARSDADLNRAVAEIRAIGGEAHGCIGDVGDPAQVKATVRAALEQFGKLDVLVNNASFLGPRVPIAQYPVSAWEDVVRINLTGSFLMIQEALKIMIPQRRGSVINVSSGVGRVGKARWGAYAASKFGVEGLTQVLADEVREFGIRANSSQSGPHTDRDARSGLSRRGSTYTTDCGSYCTCLHLSGIGRFRSSYRPVPGSSRLA